MKDTHTNVGNESAAAIKRKHKPPQIGLQSEVISPPTPPKRTSVCLN